MRNKITWLLAFVLSVYLIGWLVYTITSVQTVYQNNFTEDRIQKSISTVPKWNVEKTFYLTQTNGSSTVFEVAKFECCGTGGLVTWGGTLVMGYLNTVEAISIGTTTKQQIPEIEISILIHELLHLVTIQPAVIAKCPALAEPILQEEMAYNIESLYSQIKSLEEDNKIRLNK